MKRLTIVLAVQLLFFAAWGGMLLNSRGAALREFYLETEPVDPRALLAGAFVELSYPIGRPDICPGMPRPGYGKTVYVRLEDKGRKVPTAEGLVAVYEPAGCSFEAPSGGTWARGTLTQNRFGMDRIEYGIERFYLNENDPRRNARSGSVVSRVTMDRGGGLSLRDLVKKI